MLVSSALIGSRLSSGSAAGHLVALGSVLCLFPVALQIFRYIARDTVVLNWGILLLLAVLIPVAFGYLAVRVEHLGLGWGGFYYFVAMAAAFGGIGSTRTWPRSHCLSPR